MSDVFGLRTLPLAIGLLAAWAGVGPAVGAGKGETIPLTKLQPIDNVPSVRLSPDDRTADFVIPPIYDRPFTFSRYDLPVELDLTGADGLAFDFRCSDPTQLAGMSVLFAPADWNKCYWVPFTKVGERDGWSQMTVLREDFSTQGDSADGWRNIRTLRFFLTVNPNVRESVSCAIRNLRVVPVRHPDAEVWIVAGDVTFRERKLNGGYFADLARNHRAALETAGVTARMVFESDFPTEVPPQVRLVVLPYNQCLPEAAKAALRRFADRGGKCLLFRNQDPAFVHELSARGAGKSVFYDWAKKSVPQAAEAYAEIFKSWFPEMAAAAAQRRDVRERELSVRAQALGRRTGRAGERRFLDCHDAYGPSGGERPWEETVAFAATNGVTDLIVNFCWGATAFYRSDVLEVSPQVATRGDALESCLAACRKWGVRLHAWKCCWTVGGVCSPEMRKRLTDEGRFQTDIDGNPVPGFLCPNHPANHRLQVESMTELARKGVDGINYDFIRYNDSPYRTCFCRHCLAAFEKELGHSLTNGPQQIVGDKSLFAAWGEFRARSIGRAVCEVSERVRRENPKVEISTTGGGDGTTYRISCGRDWVTWARAGWVDFVFLMDYDFDVKRFTRLIGRQRKVDAGKAFLVPGLGPSCWQYQSSVEDAETMADMVEAVRAAGFGSWGVFQYDSRTFGYLPLLRKGLLK